MTFEAPSSARKNMSQFFSSKSETKQATVIAEVEKVIHIRRKPGVESSRLFASETTLTGDRR